MKYSKNLLEKIYGKKLADNQKIDDMITNHLCEVESIEELGGDSIIDLEITPNRYGDLLSHEGLLREICAFENTEYVSVYEEEPHIATETMQGSAIKVGARRILFVKVDLKNIKSPAWIKTTLEACGVQSKTLPVDITNMVMLITGQPVHVYDAAKCSGEFLVDEAREGEIFEMMGEKEYELSEGDLVIRDAQTSKILSLAGIKGGNHALVDENTTSFIFELGVFDESHIRQTSRRLRLATDASKRFSVHRKAVLLDGALGALLKLLEEEAGATAVMIEDSVDGATEESAQIQLPHEDIEKILGVNILSEDVQKYLTALNCEVSFDGATYSVIAPDNRVDLIYPIDVIEEIGRMFGYENIKEELPQLDFTPQIDQRTLVTTMLRKILSEVGFNEVRNHSLVSKGSLEVAYPVSKEKAFIRDTLHTSFKSSVEQSRLNKDFLETDQVCLYEIGTVFTKDAKEELHLIIFDGTKKKVKKEAFKDAVKDHHLKKILEEIEDKDGFSIYNINYHKTTIEDDYAFIGDIISDTKFVPWHQTPYVSRDVSCFIPAGTTPEEVLGWCGGTALNFLVKTPYIADTFTKDDKTSVLIRFVFQDPEGTLTDIVVNEEIEKIYKLLTEKGCEMR